MFTPEIAKKCSYLLNTDVEIALNLLFDDLITQKVAKIRPDSPDLELRINAVELGLLNKLKNYRQLLETAVKQHGNN